MRLDRFGTETYRYGVSQKRSDDGVVLSSAHWAETDYGLSAGQHAVLPEGEGKGGFELTK